MPRPTVWAVRAALLHLILGFTFGGALLANKGLDFYPALWRALPLHREMLLFGWMAQLALGVAYWILPRTHLPASRPEAMGWRGGQAQMLTSLVLLNFGVIFAGSAPALGAPPQVLLAGRVFEASAGLLFTLHAWKRLRV